MLMPKRVKRRRVHRGSMAGKAQKGNKVTYGEFGLVAMEASWITLLAPWVWMYGNLAARPYWQNALWIQEAAVPCS